MPIKSPQALLKEACQTTGAAWAVWLDCAMPSWHVQAVHGLSRSEQKVLAAHLAEARVSARLMGALERHSETSRAVPPGMPSSAKRLYMFRPAASAGLLIAGANAMDPAGRRLWRNLSIDGSLSAAQGGRPAGSDSAPAAGAVDDDRAPFGELEAGARKLNLMHDIIQQILGLQDLGEMAQIAAELMARQLPYGLVLVMLGDEAGRLMVRGISGSAPRALLRSIARREYVPQNNLLLRVFAAGESLLAGDIAAERLKGAIPGWGRGAAMCVPLRAGEQILGVITVASRDKNAFTASDLLMLESLAAILASVVSRAGQYQHLQDIVLQLEETQQELQARIEAQRDAEARLVQAAKLAAVGEMAAGVAHELNNPLTTVVGFTELAMDELPDNSPQKNDLDLVLREARRARTVVRRLLDFARQNETVRTRTDFNEVVNDVLALMRNLLHTSGVEMILNLGKDLPWIVVDRNQMKQVVLNLLHNALNAMPKGGRVFVTTRIQTRYGDQWLAISVRDTGVGIPPEYLSRIFEPFFTTRLGQGGTGLGLSVTYGIVTDHRGLIEVESQVNMGSTFTVWLPVEP